MNTIPIAFELDTVVVPIEKLLPSRKVPVSVENSKKYQQILASIREVGLIEPFPVRLENRKTGQYIILDGHVRLMALRALQVKDVLCLLAKSEETVTYNSQVNRLSTVQEHLMMLRAVERGVSPARLAKALSVDQVTIERKLTLLNGICEEAAALLKDQHFSSNIPRVLRKMKPSRQIECVELMLSANSITVSYAEAMLVATPSEQLISGQKPAKLAGVTAEQMAKMEQEMGSLQAQYKMAEQTYGQDVLHLVMVRGYLEKLLANQPVNHYLKQRQPEVLTQFEAIVRAVALDS
jgi:hypothetical protein